MQPIVVIRGNTIVVPVSLGFNVSNDTIVSHIRVNNDLTSAIIASWAVSFENDGTDGELLLTLHHSITESIVQSVGYMSLRRIGGGPPLYIIGEPLEVVFID